VTSVGRKAGDIVARRPAQRRMAGCAIGKPAASSQVHMRGY